MNVWFLGWFAAAIAQRLLELGYARRNANRIQSIGGYEVGAAHYRRIVWLHFAFFAATALEFWLRRPTLQEWMTVPAAAYLTLQAFRYWCIKSLGMFWNTRIWVVPGMVPVRSGPYRFMRHPNYAVVTMEMLVFPLLLGCFATAVLFPMLNVLVLRQRIAVEDDALATAAESQGGLIDEPR